jgi:hypothetical protein
MEEQQEPSNCSINCNIRYFCNICKTHPDQLSHHKAHLKTQKHMFQKKCFEQCLSMCFQFQNTQSIPFLELDDVNYQENTSDFILWKLKREELLKTEYPNIFFPEHKNIIYETETDFIDKFFKKLIETNETSNSKIRLNNKKIQKKHHNFINTSYEKLLDAAIDLQSPYEIACILYKTYYNNYSCNGFSKRNWLDKSDTSIHGDIIYSKLVDHISKDITKIFQDKATSLNSSTEQIEMVKFKNCNHIINFLTKKTFINDVMREARELFYNN